MNSSLRVWLAAAAVVAVSVGLKVAAGPQAGEAARSASQLAALHAFLAGAADGAVAPLTDGGQPGALRGWRFQTGACRAAVFPSGRRGTMDLAAKNRSVRGDRLAYVYRGQARRAPPTWELARDVALYRLAGPWAAGGEPGYVVVTYARDCGGPPNLPWRRLADF